MNKLALSLLAIAVLAGAVLASLPMLVSSDAVRQRILDQAVEITGREMSFRDNPRVFFNPFLGIEINGVIFRDPAGESDDPPLLQMDKLRGKLALLPALFGRADIEFYEFVRPRFQLRRNIDGRANWSFPEGQVWHVLEQVRIARENGAGTEAGKSAEVAHIRLGRFRIVDGALEYLDEAVGRREVVTNINATLNWPDTSSALAIGGDSIWREESFAYDIRLGNPLSLAAGSNQPLAVELSSSAFDFRFDGTANMLADLYLSGPARFESPSVRRLAKFFGQDMQPASTLSGIVAEGSLKGTARQLQLSEATLELDGNQGRGALKLAQGDSGKWSINATLAAQELDFSPYLGALRQSLAINGDSLPGAELVELVDLDLRISASRALLDDVSLQDFAASIAFVEDGALFDLGNAMLFGGTLVGKATLSIQEEVPSLAIEADFGGFDASAVSNAFGLGRFVVTGDGKARLEARAHGKTANAMARSAVANAEFSLREGLFNGVDFHRWRSLAADGQLEARDLELSGETAFNALNGVLSLTGNNAWLQSMDLSSDVVRARLSGRVAPNLSAIALRLALGEPVEPKSDGAEAEAEPENTPFDAVLFIGGSLDNPLVTRLPYGGRSGGRGSPASTTQSRAASN